MHASIHNNRDFWAGLMLVGVGAASMWLARDYAFGTSLRMGPGYFPAVLGGVLVAFGLILLVRAVRFNEEIEGNWSIRALVVMPLSLAAFGALMDTAGFIPALVVLIVGSAAASREFRLKEVVPLAIAVTFFSIAVFIWALGLPYRLTVGF